jgi:hypothetical protein
MGMGQSRPNQYSRQNSRKKFVNQAFQNSAAQAYRTMLQDWQSPRIREHPRRRRPRCLIMLSRQRTILTLLWKKRSNLRLISQLWPSPWNRFRYFLASIMAWTLLLVRWILIAISPMVSMYHFRSAVAFPEGYTHMTNGDNGVNFQPWLPWIRLHRQTRFL